MRAGKLDREITIEAPGAVTVDTNGTPTMTWANLATVRAELVEASTAEDLRGYGEAADARTVFRIRWLDGVTAKHRVQYAGRILNVREIIEIGRRRGLELRCEEVRV